jgi:4-hydroxyphenylpyruvate dioxygenase-like putative hemolysin
MPLNLAQARRTAPALWDNPMGTDGFEFVEYTAPDPKLLVSKQSHDTVPKM